MALRGPSSRALAHILVVLLLAGAAVALTVAPAAATPTDYVQMSDGIKIAVNIRMPDGFEKGQTYPTIFEMSGYDGGSADGEDPTGGEGSRGLTKIFYSDYVTVHASIRGTGCSGGEFDLFSWRSALDGRELIEWIADQPWSNGKVGIYGHSYGGITGFMVGATQPPHLTSMSVSGLIDDIYRGIVYPGGVSNYGFPLLWTGGVRPLYDVGGGTWDGMDDGDPRCAQNIATGSRGRTTLNDPIVQGLQDTDNTWMQARSLINYADRISVPIHITGAFQDEQTGPRGPYHLFEAVSGVPKRLLMTNGVHGTQTAPEEVWKDRRAWMDHWMLGEDGGHGTVAADRSSVTTLLELVDNESNGRKDSRTFPLEDTQWTRFFLDAQSKIDLTPPRTGEAYSPYVSGSPRQSWSYQAGHTFGSPITTENAPDELVFKTEPFKEPVAMIGPATATLFLASTATDTEVFVQLIDEAPNGSRYYIQRGMLKASHRSIDPGLSDWDGKILYRPYRPHTNPTQITPGEIYPLVVEIFPFGHVFRPGHRLVVKVHTPPALDSYYAYVPKRPAGINLLYHDADHSSFLMLPVVSLKGVKLGPEPKPCMLTGVRCIP
ncbi:MAG TPA: CocE/NonD family hydrolase [Actinomycetota bacterium]|nr:CocE/NonD family hydrolase [Actinomycetota bacterium]